MGRNTATESRKRRPTGRGNNAGDASPSSTAANDNATTTEEKSKKKQGTSRSLLFLQFFGLMGLIGFAMMMFSSGIFLQPPRSPATTNENNDAAAAAAIMSDNILFRPDNNQESTKSKNNAGSVVDRGGGSSSGDILLPSGGGNLLPEEKRYNKKMVTALQEPPSTLQTKVKPLPRRATSRALLKATEFPQLHSCSSTLIQDFGRLVVNDFFANSTDPWLPWIHDYFVENNNNTSSRVVFVGQNRRNCETGQGTEDIMEFWAPQIALFQPVPIVRTDFVNGTSSFRLYDGPDPRQFTPRTKHDNTDILQESIIPETRFLCRFHWQDEDDDDTDDLSASITLSEFPFNYEYVSWRKRQAMFKEGDLTRSAFWVSQLIFSCPIPPAFQQSSADHESRQVLLVDVIPIRTSPRSDQVYLTPKMVGQELFEEMQSSASFYNLAEEYGNNHVLPKLEESGRWANLPVCAAKNPELKVPPQSPPIISQQSSNKKKSYRLVACTWTSASYHRRGEDEDQPLDDNTLRLREWLIFHRLVGFDHVVIYDNTPIDNYNESPLHALVQEFDSSFVTHQPWSAVICNNNRPHHKHPGDRSSQYAAEASCRERYGPMTDWMAFIDTDEYLTPMMKDPATGAPSDWNAVLDSMEERGIAIMKLKSGRNLPRVHLMDPLENQTACGDPITAPFLKEYTPEPCLIPRRNETFLNVYNCDSVKLPRPERFARAMKQIYRPDYVYSHFVHYSTVTEYGARYYDPKRPIENIYNKFDEDKEVFLDELNEGTLVHARSVVPKETMFRSKVCQYHYPKLTCFLGYECPESLDWIDDKGREKGARTKKILNAHQDAEGNFCSCWVNKHVENVWVPKLEAELAKHSLEIN